ncbi:MAG: DNA replication and repair protein RecF [Actinomycetota bacterium]|nr:DNA replication and repair protein RecF [Actinomycetota bacterium]
MRVARVAADQIRSLSGVELEPANGLTVIIGPNGAGKTNLVEAIYFGLTARSFRTADRRDLIPFGASWARSRVDVVSGEEDGRSDSGVTHSFMSAIDRSEGTRYTMDGAAIDRSEAANHRPAVTVFSPDRLELVKGPPAGRRSHVDSFVAARWPRKAGLRREYGRALAQRNALLGRLREGGGDRSQLATWDRQVSITGTALAASRSEAVAEISAPWSSAAGELGLEGDSRILYRPGASLEPEEFMTGLASRIDADLRMGRTTWGPHHDEIRLEFNGRQLRRFGSQGQQRIGLLSLLFAERESLLASGRPSPLMLLDDVMSELDESRRDRLVDRLLEGGQTVITAAEGELIPDRPGLSRIRIRDLTGSPEPEESKAPEESDA